MFSINRIVRQRQFSRALRYSHHILNVYLSALANPADLIKVRMQAHYPDGSPYRNTRHAFATVYREGAKAAAGTGSPVFGGLRTLWRGVEATTFRGVVLSISQIASYDQVKQMLKGHGIMQEGMGLHLTASLFAGYVVNPMPLVHVSSAPASQTVLLDHVEPCR